MASSTKDNHNSNVASIQTPPSGHFHSNQSVYVVWNLFNISVSTVSVAYVLIVVAILVLALAFVHKHVVRPSWKPGSQQLNEKLRLFMAGSIGDTTRKVFNGWSRSRQDTTTISSRDEKSRRLSPDTSSSSSTSLSPSVLPTHTASPRLYKKTSNSQLAPQRRPNSRQKAQAQNSSINTLSTISDSPSTTSLCSDSSLEQPSTCVEQDESKTTVTINVVDSLNSRTEQAINDDIDTPRESISDDHLDASTSQSNNHKISPEHEDRVDSWNRSCQNSVPSGGENNTLDMVTSPSITSTHDVSSTLHKKNSTSRLKEQRRQNSRQKDQAVFVEHESDDEYQSDRNIIRRHSSENPVIEKNFQDSMQDESFIKSVHRRRRRRTRSSKNNNQQNFQREQQRPEQKPQKQESSPKQEPVQHKMIGELPRSRKSGDPVRSMSYPIWQKQLHVQQHPTQQHLNELNKSLQTGESAKPIWQKPMNQNPDSAQPHSQQRSDQSPYLISVNRRNSGQPSNTTTVPAKVELNKNTTIFRESELPTTSHTETSTRNTHPIDHLNASTRFTSYADVISPHNRHSSVTTKTPQIMNSLLSNEGKITTPAPIASVRNVTNRQWYSPFGSGLSIQFTPPTPPQDSHSQLPSPSKNSLFSVSTFNSSSTIPERHRSVIAPPPPISAPNNSSSSMSMFTSSPFSTLNASSSNKNQLNPTNTSPTTSSSLRGTLFGKKHPILDKEKGELSDQEVDEGELVWGEQKIESSVVKNNIGRGKLNEKRIQSSAWYESQRSQQPQFSLFDKRLSFMYPPKS